MDTLFDHIEKRYGFTLPADYRDARARGWIDGDEPLNLMDMHWLPLEEIAGYEFQDHQFPGFVPFAEDGGSQLWCWQPAVSGPQGPRVVVTPLDCDEAEVYAPDFRTAMYRHLLEQACMLSPMEKDLEEQAEWVRECAGKLSGVLTPEEREFLDSILARPIESEVMPAVRPTRWYYNVHPKSELRDRIRRLFPDERFTWMKAV